MKYFYFILIVVVVSFACNKRKAKIFEYFEIKYETGLISSDQYKMIIESNSFLNPCSYDLSQINKELAQTEQLTYRKIKNIGKYNIFLLTVVGGSPYLEGWWINKLNNSIQGSDETYMAYPPNYISCLVKLTPGCEYYLFETHSFGPSPNVIKGVFKIKYFNSKDSSFVNAYVGTPEINYYKGVLDFIDENKQIIDSIRYREFIDFYKGYIMNDFIMQQDSIGEKNILKQIRNLY